MRASGGAGGARLGGAQRAGGIIELLRRGGAFRVQACDAFVRRPRQDDGRIGRLFLGRRGGDILIGRHRGRPRASRMGGKVAPVEHDQDLARPHAIARHRADLPDRREDARHDRGGRPRLNHATRLECVRDVGHGHSRDGDRNRCRLAGGCRLRTRASREDEADAHGDAACKQ